MTPHGKAHYSSHYHFSPNYTGASVRRRTPVECQSYDNSVATENRNISGCGSASQSRTSARRSAARRAVQSTVLLRGQGVRSWCANHWGGARRRQISARTNMSAKISVPLSGEFPSATWPDSQRLARPNSFLPSAPAAMRGQHADGCAASVRRQARSMRSWPTSSLGSNEFCSGGAAVARLAHNQEVVGSIPTPATTSRERMQRKHRATRPVDRCGFRSTLVAAVGVYRRNVEQGGRTTADQELAAQSFSSGDGLGIQQPGSMTWGGLLVPTAPSGRADESAMCPAVARSFSGRAHG